jgi:IS4 transposase
MKKMGKKLNLLPIIFLSANAMSELNKRRWQVEIFFGDIKQLLHIK